MDKLKLKHFLLNEEKALLEEARKNLSDYHKENSLDQDNVKDLDDLAQSDSSIQFEHDLENRIAIHLEAIQHIEELTFESCNIVSPGSIVKVGGKKLVIATPKRPFQYDGESYEAISVSAPIYKLMHGKRAGDTYEFHGESHKIEDVI